ncbi:MAG: SRPBCC domain-containing protein [Solirubrobacteraceae bacterium]
MAKSYTVTRKINAGPDRIWALLTDSAAYPSWNPAVVSLEGPVAAGERIKLVSTISPSRTFALSVSDLEPERRMVWSSGMPLGLFRGVRTFALSEAGPGETEFSMTEVYSGPMAGLITRAIPDQTDSFAQFADGLKIAAESDGSAPGSSR